MRATRATVRTTGRRIGETTARWVTARSVVPLAAVTAFTVLAACTGSGDADEQPDAAAVAAGPMPGPALVRIQDPGLHPEGVEWDAGGERFLVSSVTRGTVTEVHDDGSHTVFIDDPDIVSSIGIHIDRSNGRLLVANSNLAVFQGGDSHAMIGSYDLETGERIFMTDLGALTPGGPQFANDVVTAPDGTAYVTNFQTAAIYRVSLDGTAEVLVSGDALAPGGINGIEYHRDGYLLAAQVNAAALLKISLDGSEVTAVGLPEPLLIDGLVFLADGRLAAVAGTGEGETGRTEVVLLSSTDGWTNASIAGRWEAARDATTAAVRDGQVYVVDARFGDMGSDAASSFDITRAELP
ncbi:MAG: hypothetical protein R3195_09845 [Gemmatimonadota bacterium]|nr:hypothetical protein [Gemmatimonadota bacterium]